MVGPAQKLPLFGKRKMPLNKRVKILVRNKEIRTFLQRLQRTVHGSGCAALYRIFIEQTLKLSYIVTSEQLFLKVPYLEILREVFFLIRRPAAVEGIGVHKGVYRKKREMERAARLRDPDCLVNCPVHVFRSKQMIHGAENKGHIKGVIVKQTKVSSLA